MINGHGDDLHRYDGQIASNFSSNVYNAARHEGLFAHLSEHLAAVCHYPEPQPVTAEGEWAEQLRLHPAEVCLTNGATEAIYLVAQAFRGRHSVILQPTFSEYADACRLHGHRVTMLYDWPERLPAGTDLMWICNPNNPTGQVIPAERLEALIDSRPNTLFVIDQSYGAFTRRPLPELRALVQRGHVAVVHSLTKTFAVPGLRIGLLTAERGLAERIREVRMPWSVNALALEAARYLVRRADNPVTDLPRLLAERERVATALEATRVIETWPSDTHFLLAQLRIGRAAALKDYLAREHGMLIRDASNFDGLGERHFRLAVQTPPENDALLTAVGQWIAL